MSDKTAHEIITAVVGYGAADRILSALSAAGFDEPSRWQTIESAPKDGSYVLGWRSDWDRPFPIWYAHNRRIDKAYWKTSEEWDDYELAEPENAPSHWRPLPTPPPAPRGRG